MWWAGPTLVWWTSPPPSSSSSQPRTTWRRPSYRTLSKVGVLVLILPPTTTAHFPKVSRFCLFRSSFVRKVAPWRCVLSRRNPQDSQREARSEKFERMAENFAAAGLRRHMIRSYDINICKHCTVAKHWVCKKRFLLSLNKLPNIRVMIAVYRYRAAWSAHCIKRAFITRLCDNHDFDRGRTPSPHHMDTVRTNSKRASTTQQTAICYGGVCRSKPERVWKFGGKEWAFRWRPQRPPTVRSRNNGGNRCGSMADEMSETWAKRRAHTLYRHDAHLIYPESGALRHLTRTTQLTKTEGP